MKPLYRLSIVRERMGTYDARKPLRTSADVAALVRPHFECLDREHFVTFLLDGKNKPIGMHPVSVGTVNASLVHPREVFKAAILAGAACIILAHNHPSGDPMPSLEDRAITTRLVEAGTLLGIPVLDHLVIGEPDYYSFKDNGAL